MSAVVRVKKLFTFDEFCTLVKDGNKADLIDGVIYLASPDNIEANTSGGWLYRLLSDYADELELGSCYVSRVACKLSDVNAPEPDVLFVPKKDRKKILRGRIEGAPGVAIEVVSPDSVDRDYDFKRDLYEKYGVREYWIVDEAAKRATFLRLGAHGKYREVKVRNGIFRSRVVRGFWLRVEWLWAETRPLKREALAEILKK